MAEVEPSQRVQKVWLVIYWWAVLVALYLLVSAILGAFVGATGPAQLAIVSVSFIAVTIGALMAMRIRRRGVTNLVFVKSTTTIRVIAVAWIALGFVLIAIPVIEVLASAELEGITLANGLLGTVGSLSLLAVVGPGYAEYREALAGAKKPLT